jgi:MDMPI C-terminal domain
MQTHEATMHRVDAELTAGLPISPINPEVAADGIDHAVNVMWASAPAELERRVTGTIELTATDTHQSWLVKTIRWSGQAWGQTFHDQSGCERAAAGEPDATVIGTAEDLELLVWTRADRAVGRSGDQHALSEFQAMLDDGIQ